MSMEFTSRRSLQVQKKKKLDPLSLVWGSLNKPSSRVITGVWLKITVRPSSRVLRKPIGFKKRSSESTVLEVLFKSEVGDRSDEKRPVLCP